MPASYVGPIIAAGVFAAWALKRAYTTQVTRVIRETPPQRIVNTTLSALPTVHNGRAGVRLANDVVELVILCGGGHIAKFCRLDTPMSNPLWEPPWPTVDPALRRLAASGSQELITRNFDFADPLEGSLLSCIAGHNLVADVFGAHSKGEVASGLCFHGEAGLITWEVSGVVRDENSISVALRATLPVTQLEVRREFTLVMSSPTVSVREHIKNLVKFERALGIAQHVTIGEAWLKGGCSFACNADKGHTFDDDEKESTIRPATEFTYPWMPGKKDGSVDWQTYPRGQKGSWNEESNLATLRVQPKAELGWFVCAQGDGWALSYVWERAAFPWLVTWEECNARGSPPWNHRTLTRGLEFSSYCLPVSRQWNVSKGNVLDTPAFQWLDGNEERTTTFYLTLQHLSQSLQRSKVSVSLAESSNASHRNVLIAVEKSA